MNPLIIPVFLPNLGCREQCLFCNQKAAATAVPSPPDVREFIRTSVDRIRLDRVRERQVAFYGGSFTAMEREDQLSYLRAVQPFVSSGAIDSIRISTRPDALDEEGLSLIKGYGVKTVEIGTQSMIDEILLLSRRGHRAEDTLRAASLFGGAGVEFGIHLMVGLPGDTLDRFLETLERVIDLRPDFVRVHPTLVLRGAPLELLWRAGEYSPLTLRETVEWLKRGLLKLERASIPVARIGLQPTKELEDHILAGPFHPALHQRVDSEIFFDMAVEIFEAPQEEVQPLLFCHPKEISNVRGQRNGNMERLRDRFGLREISVKAKEDLPRGSLLLHTRGGERSIKRTDLHY